MLCGDKILVKFCLQYKICCCNMLQWFVTLCFLALILWLCVTEQVKSQKQILKKITDTIWPLLLNWF